MSLTAGTRVGAYEVLGSLGAGGMGEVYRARDARLDRDVALKILPETFAFDPDRLARFEREAKTLASLNHPHIAHIYGVEESGATRALVMELVEGETLAERIARGSIRIPEAVAIARQIADALDAAHETGIVHRDLKPANIKLRPDAVAKVLDFGLAKILTADGSIRDDSPTLTVARTGAGVVLGTAAYMSPEQARGRITAVFAIRFWPRTAARPAATLTAVPLTTYPGYESHPSLSPDGSQVAFTWNGERQDNLDIYVKLVGPGTPLRLTTDPAEDTSPAWSPDGRWIAFLRVLPKGKAALIVVPALGGAERQLGEINVTWFIAGPDFGSGASWSSDSASIIVTDNPSPTEPGGLFAWSVATGERRRLTTSPKSSLDISSALSPDGRTLAFTRFAGFGISDVYVLPVGAQLQPTGDPRRVTYDNRFATSPVWMPDGREILFTSGSLTSAVAGLFAVDPTRADGRGATTRSLGIADHAGPASISHPPGSGRSRLVYVESHFDTGIWRIELPRAQNAPSGAPPASVPFIVSTRPEYQPHYSPDGQKVAFVSASSGISEIWTCDKSGVNLAQLTSSAWPETASPRWSPDGSQIAFHARPEGGGDIYTVPATGGPPKRITDDAGDEWGASWSPDGQWVYFTSNRSGRQEIWKAPAAGGGSAVQMTRNGGIGPTASSDGRYVYYAKGLELWRLPLNGGDESRVLGPLSDWSRFVPTVDGVYFVAGPPPPMKSTDEYAIAFLRFSDQQITTIARLDRPPFLGLTLSPDGRWLLYSQIDQSGTDLMLVDSIR